MTRSSEEVRAVLLELEAQGADLAALRANLALSPAERIAELVAMNHFHAEVQSRTLEDAVRAGLEAREIEIAHDRLREVGG